MSPARTRVLSIDDPVGGQEACHVAPPSQDVVHARFREIAVEDVRPNPDQPRKHFDDDALCSLADSIRERGVLQPIIVQPLPAGGFELVAGERRWRSAKLAGLSTIPALINDVGDGAGSLEVALIENVVRQDLTLIEEARTVASLLEDLGVTATLLSKRLGRSRTDLAHTVRLLDLPDEAIELIDAGVLTKGHGKVLLSEPDHHRRRALARRAARDGLSVRALEAEIGRGSNPRSDDPFVGSDALDFRGAPAARQRIDFDPADMEASLVRWLIERTTWHHGSTWPTGPARADVYA